MLAQVRKKLIEVALPLAAINAEASRRKQKSPKGYPTNIHKWWAQIPVAAARGVLFAQLVDDPGSWPEHFPTEAAIAAERERLHGLIGKLVEWDAREETLAAARWEIAHSLARGRGESPPAKQESREVSAWLAANAPPVLDPFSGAGTIPLEAQRLGLTIIASDLNPVAVLITRALVGIPPLFKGRQPIHPEARVAAQRTGWNGGPASGLAEDLRRYGTWVREEAFHRVGHLYPKVKVRDGSEADVVAWLWARTVRSPNPAAKGVMVPLASSFVLSSRAGKQIWLEPQVDFQSATYKFEVRSGEEAPEAAKNGLKVGQSTFRCVITDATISADYIDKQANEGHISFALLAIVVKTGRGRSYLPADQLHSNVTEHVSPTWKPEHPSRGTFASNAQGRRYGFKTYGDYFTPRQLMTLTIFTDFVGEIHAHILSDAAKAGMPDDRRPLAEGGTGSRAYADAITTYLALVVSRLVHYNCTLCRWLPKDNAVAMGLPQQAIPMVWDFAEGNPFGESSSEFFQCLKNVADCLDAATASSPAEIGQVPAQHVGPFAVAPVISTDPPYYDNVGYSDLSDFFYGWLRRMLAPIYPTEYATLAVPKAEELVANPYRHGREGAEPFFLKGMQQVMARLA